MENDRPTTTAQTVTTSPAELNAEDRANSVPLTEIAAGQSGVVVRIEEDDHAMLIRLKTMGMHEGRSVRVVRQGSRVIVSCGGTRIGLSSEVAQHVLAMPMG